MDLTNSDLLALLLALLPGLITAELVSALTVREQRKPLERVIQALLYTFLNHVTWIVVVGLVNGALAWAGRPALADTTGVHMVGLAVCAIAWGFGVAWIINTGRSHRFLRERLGITKTGSRPSVWYDVFYDRQQYVVVHLKDERRVYGWPLKYSEHSDRGHLFLTRAEWLEGPGGQARPEFSLLINVADIQYIEFVEFLDATE